MRRICVFCGANKGTQESYLAAAHHIGEVLAKRGLGLVYGGGKVGLMGALAEAVLAAGGEVIGVIPAFMVEKEMAHLGLTQLRIVPSLHERKAVMARLADAFIALPGGYGTLEEFFEALTFTQLGLRWKPCGLLNVGGYYDPLLTFLDQLEAEQFITAADRALVLAEAEVEPLLDQVTRYRTQVIHQEGWKDRGPQSYVLACPPLSAQLPVTMLSEDMEKGGYAHGACGCDRRAGF